MLSVTHNLLAMNAGRQFNIVNGTKVKTAEKLSSGYRINRSADDAAGLAMSEKMRRQIRGLGQASANTQDGISLCQVADGALNEVNDMLHRITELSVKAANGTNTQQDREAIQSEINQILEEIDRISDNTTFNEMKIFKGDVTDSAAGTIQTSMAAEVTANYVNGGDYQVTATENGGVELFLKVADGTLTSFSSFAWSEIKNTFDTSKTLADTDIEAGTYAMEQNGIRLTFDVKEGSKLSDVAEALNGAEFSIEKDSVSFNPVKVNGVTVKHTTAGANPGAEAIFSTAPYTMHADEDGMWMTNNAGTVTTRKVTWNSMGVSADSIAGETFTYACPDTGLQVGLKTDSNATFEEIINKINRTTVTYRPGTDFSSSGFGWYGTSDAKCLIGNVKVTADFLEAAIPSNVDRMGIIMCYEKEGSSLADLKIAMKAIKDGGILEDNYTIHYLEAADQTTRDFLASTSFVQGSETLLTFSDSYNNLYEVNVRIESNTCTADDVLRSIGGASYSFGYHGMSVNMPTNNLVHTNFDVSEMQWQGNAADTSGKTGFWIHCAVEAGIGMNLEIDTMSTGILGIDNLDVTTVTGAGDAITRTKAALQSVSSNRAKIGAQQNRLEHTINNLDNIAENTTAAESQIRDADMATEMMKFSQQNILSQAGQSVLAQVQHHNQNVLSLLQ